jgi:putative NIF3 family GTP cyclohydrolase 1 type 2
MKTSEFEQLLPSLFGRWLTTFEDEGEYGFTNQIERDNKRVAYATNLTPETIEKAIQANADLLLTHMMHEISFMV